MSTVDKTIFQMAMLGLGGNSVKEAEGGPTTA